MCLIMLFKLVIKFLVPLAIIGVVVYLVFFKDNAGTNALQMLNFLK